MLTTRTRYLVGLATLLTLSSVAASQPADFGSGSRRPIRIMIGGGASVPIGDFGDTYDSGYNVQGSLLFNFAGFPIALRTDVNYTRLKLKDLIGLPPSSSYSSDATSLLGGLANLSFSLGVGPIRPYVIAGLGAFKIDPAELSSATPTESSIEFAVNGGAGLRIKLGSLEAFVEGRLNNVYTDKGVIDTKTIQMIPVTFGIIF